MYFVSVHASPQNERRLYTDYHRMTEYANLFVLPRTLGSAEIKKKEEADNNRSTEEESERQ